MDSVGENGFENDALKMHRLVNNAMNPNEAEDIAAGKYDPEGYKPEYPRE